MLTGSLKRQYKLWECVIDVRCFIIAYLFKVCADCCVKDNKEEPLLPEQNAKKLLFLFTFLCDDQSEPIKSANLTHSCINMRGFIINCSGYLNVHRINKNEYE